MNIAYPSSYIAWDLETSGLDAAAGAKILEIGAAKVSNGQIVERKSWLLNHGIEIPEAITAINGITKEMIDRDGVDPKEALKEFFNFFVVGTPHLTHNGIRFDIPFLVESASQIFGCTLGKTAELRASLFSTAIDTAVLVKGRKLEMDRMWNEDFKTYADRVMAVYAKGVKYNVGVCCDELEIAIEVEQHRALGDVELTNEIFKRLIAN